MQNSIPVLSVLGPKAFPPHPLLEGRKGKPFDDPETCGIIYMFMMGKDAIYIDKALGRFEEENTEYSSLKKVYRLLKNPETWDSFISFIVGMHPDLRYLEEDWKADNMPKNVRASLGSGSITLSPLSKKKFIYSFKGVEYEVIGETVEELRSRYSTLEEKERMAFASAFLEGKISTLSPEVRTI